MKAKLRFELPKHLVVWFITSFTFFPFYLTVVISFKDQKQFLQPNFWFFQWPLHFSNYTTAWSEVYRYIGNTMIVALATMVIGLSIASLAAFVFARYEFPFRKFLFSSIIMLLMVPGVLNLVPMYIMVRKMGLIDNLLVLILPAVAGAQVFSIYILRTFYRGIPKDIFDSARIDGASDLKQFWYIAVPLSKPIMSVLAINIIVAQWNVYVWAFVTISSDKLKTITIGLAHLTNTNLGNWGPVMAGYVICSLPLIILFCFAMRTFVDGLASGAIKA